MLKQLDTNVFEVEQPTVKGALFRPYVTVAMVISTDGKVSSSRCQPAQLSTPRSRRRLYLLRALNDAILCGAQTIRVEDADLAIPNERLRTRRTRYGKQPDPMRIIVSSSGSFDPKLKLFEKSGGQRLLIVPKSVSTGTLCQLARLVDSVLVVGQNSVDLQLALHLIKSWKQINRLLCEGGPTVIGQLLSQDLVDELHLTIVPKIIGYSEAPTLIEGDSETLPDIENDLWARRFILRSARQLPTGEIFCRYLRKRPN